MTTAETAALLAGIPTIVTALVAIITAFRANATAKIANNKTQSHNRLPHGNETFGERTGTSE